METLINFLAIILAVIITFAFVNTYEKRKLKYCKIYYLPRKE
jgi:hypothetical protein